MAGMSSRHHLLRDVLPFWRYKNTRPSQMIMKSNNYINKDLSCLDFVPIENELTYKGSITRQFYLRTAISKWSGIVLLGFAIGVLGAFQSIITEELFVVKNNYISYLYREEGTFAAHIFWACSIFFPVLMCTAIIVYCEPNARGLGVSRIYAYLNGINTNDFTSIRTAVIKLICINLCAIASLSGGNEEPFIHFGALLGGALSQLRVLGWRPFAVFADPVGRRDLVTAGTVAAVSAAFGTPIGAVLFVLEEGITFWNASLTYIVFVCGVTSALTLQVFRTLITIGSSYNTRVEHSLFFHLQKFSLEFESSDIAIFVLYGAIGALAGSLWNVCFIFSFELREWYRKKKLGKFLEGASFGALFLTLSVVFLHITKDYCIKRFEPSSRLTNSKEINMHCKDGELEEMGIFIFQDSKYILRSLVMSEELSDDIIWCGLIYFMLTSILQTASVLPSGIMIPNLIVGAAWGHIVATGILPTDRISEMRPKFTFLGALAQVSGTTRLTLSLGVILIESSGRTNFAIPVFVISVTARWLGALLSEPIYRTIAYLNAYPLIRTTILPVSSSFKATDVMSSPVIAIPMTIEVKDVLKLMERNYHENYPILIGGKVAGVVSAKQILTLLETNRIAAPQNDKEKKELNEILHIHDARSFKKVKEQIKLGTYTPKQRGSLNFQQISHKSPYIIQENMSLRRIYTLFLSVGACYVFVVDESCNIIGIISRKDVARFRRVEQLLIIRTEIVPVV